MGNKCCQYKINSIEEIETCNNIYELTEFVTNKLKQSEMEITELKSYLKNHRKKPTSVDVGNFSDEILNKRIDYVSELQKSLKKVIYLLKQHPEADLLEIKKWLIDFQQIYSWVYDENQRHVDWLYAFETFINGCPIDCITNENKNMN